MTGYRGRIARSLVNARESADVSQRELAERLGRRQADRTEMGEWRDENFDGRFSGNFRRPACGGGTLLQMDPPPGALPQWAGRYQQIQPRQAPERPGALLWSAGIAVEVEQEYYILFADHGSDYYGMRQQRIANLQTPLRDRRRICGQIIGNYYEARELGALTDPNGPQPNMDILLACYRASAESVRNGSNRYAIDRAMLGPGRPAIDRLYRRPGGAVW